MQKQRRETNCYLINQTLKTFTKLYNYATLVAKYFYFGKYIFLQIKKRVYVHMECVYYCHFK